MFFKKKDKKIYLDTDIVSPVQGDIFPVEEVEDSVFSEQMMGKTISISPCKGKSDIKSPANGKLEVLYSTGHAFAVRMKDGTGLMVHIGIDTVRLEGKGFKICAKQDEMVRAGQTIVSVDFDKISEAGYDISVMLIVIDNPACKTFKFKQNMFVNSSDDILE